MPVFITIGYGSQAGYDGTDEALRNEAHAHDAWLAAQGTLMGMAGSPIQVRNHDGAGVQTETGAYLRSELPIAGFAVIEAADADAAVELVAKSPCAIARGVVEVWPVVSPGA
jgi:hypothetical protein